MKRSAYKSYDELPLFLNADIVAKTLGIAPSSAYELLHESGFPSLRIGSRIVVPNEVYALDLDAPAIAVYCYLLSIENRRTFTCYPSYKTIGDAVKLSANTVRKYIGALVDKSLISTQPTSVFTRDGLKRNGNLLYTILPIAEAVELHNARQMKKFEREQAAASALKKLPMRGDDAPGASAVARQ